MLFAVAAPLWVPFALLVLYCIAIQYERGGWWNLCWLVAAPALVLDALLTHALFPMLLLYWPDRGEWTFSQVLARLIERGDWTGEVARYIKRVLDAIAPSGIHIKPRTA